MFGSVFDLLGTCPPATPPVSIESAPLPLAIGVLFLIAILIAILTKSSPGDIRTGYTPRTNYENRPQRTRDEYQRRDTIREFDPNDPGLRNHWTNE